MNWCGDGGGGTGKRGRRGHYSQHNRKINRSFIQSIHMSFFLIQSGPLRQVHHLPLLAPLEIEQKPVTSWDKTEAESIWDKGTWAWFKDLDDPSGSWRSWKQMEETVKHELMTGRKIYLIFSTVLHLGKFLHLGASHFKTNPGSPRRNQGCKKKRWSKNLIRKWDLFVPMDIG